MPLKHVLSVGVLVLCLGAIAYFALISEAALPDHPMIRGFNDLVFHALAFGALTVPSWYLLGPRAGSLTVFAVILLVELAQIPVSGRQATFEDVVSGVFGWFVIAVLWLSLKALWKAY